MPITSDEVISGSGSALKLDTLKRLSP